MYPAKIILLSADELMVKRIRACLAREGYQVTCNAVGYGAVEFILTEKPSLVILDRDLPGMNSLAIIRNLRASEMNTRLPIILTGANMCEEDALIGLEVGADLCLLETFHPKVFVARVRSLLRRYEVI